MLAWGSRLVGTTSIRTYLLKLFDITEGINLQFQADFFNAFNQTNFNDPGIAFGTLASPNTGFGKISAAAPGRNIQMGFKLVF
jgi:hypothetical protein